MDESNKRKMEALLKKKNMDFGPLPQRKKTIG
jgi:hypothetical protein